MTVVKCDHAADFNVSTPRLKVSLTVFVVMARVDEREPERALKSSASCGAFSYMNLQPHPRTQGSLEKGAQKHRSMGAPSVRPYSRSEVVGAYHSPRRTAISQAEPYCYCRAAVHRAHVRKNARAQLSSHAIQVVRLSRARVLLEVCGAPRLWIVAPGFDSPDLLGRQV